MTAVTKPMSMPTPIRTTSSNMEEGKEVEEEEEVPLLVPTYTSGRTNRRGSHTQAIFLPTAFSLTIVLTFILSRVVTMDSKAQRVVLDKARGKSMVITGASSGIGLAAVKNLYRHEVQRNSAVSATGLSEDEEQAMLVLMGCRDLVKCEKEKTKILQQVCNEKKGKDVKSCKNYDHLIQLECLELDLESQKSVKKFAKSVQQSLKKHRRNKGLDILINNGGVMGVEEERLPNSKGVLSVDKTMQVNHIGHFLLTSLLMPNLLASTHGGRVVNVSSLLGYMWVPQSLEADLTDFELRQKPYNSLVSYRQSKRANLLFTQALHDRFYGINNFSAVATHPGYSRTSLQMSGWKFAPEYVKKFMARNPIMSMSSSGGSMTTLKAALSLEKVPSNKVVGPIFAAIGTPIVIGSSLSPFPSFGSIDASAVDALWDYSESVIGESFYKHK